MSNSPPPDDPLQNLFKSVPEASAPAKARALNAAMQAFDEGIQPQQKSPEPSAQGFWQRLRLTLKQRQPEGLIMQSRWIWSGAAASVAMIALVFGVVRVTQPDLTSGMGLADITMPEKKENRGRFVSDVITESEYQLERDVSHIEELALAEPSAIAPVPQQPSSPRIAKMVMPSRAESPMERSDSGPQSQRQYEDEFNHFDSNAVKQVSEEPVSTFSVDVDTAAYSFVRRQLRVGQLPEKDAVRLEEMVNYFDYQYPEPASKDQPFSSQITVVDSPWKAGNKLIQIGLKGYQLPREELPKSNLVFLLDVSGSMNQPDKLPLVKQSMGLLLSQLNPDDTVAIAVYAGAAGTVLEPTPAREKQTILQALDRLSAGGSTAGGEGIKLAYQLAAANFEEKAVNRVILATDGDFNVGLTDHQQLTDFIERERDKGIYLSVLGFGQGNYHDNLMQSLAQTGNGVAAYIDTLGEAQKVLVHQATSTLFTIAKDVKIQVEFNPATVKEYRLLGYETRLLAREDFNNDKVDAGDIGSGHTVTALYEITPVAEAGLIDDLRYGTAKEKSNTAQASEFGFVKLRYKKPEDSHSQLLEQPIAIEAENFSALAIREANFAIAVAGFAELLRGGQYQGDWNLDDALALAQANKGDDPYGYRTEFVQLIRTAKLAQP